MSDVLHHDITTTVMSLGNTIFQLHCNPTGSLSYLQSIIDQNVVMHHINVEEMQATVLKDSE